jgi:hypothetical protein
MAPKKLLSERQPGATSKRAQPAALSQPAGRSLASRPASRRAQPLSVTADAPVLAPPQKGRADLPSNRPSSSRPRTPSGKRRVRRPRSEDAPPPSVEEEEEEARAEAEELARRMLQRTRDATLERDSDDTSSAPPSAAQASAAPAPATPAAASAAESRAAARAADEALLPSQTYAERAAVMRQQIDAALEPVLRAKESLEMTVGFLPLT